MLVPSARPCHRILLSCAAISLFVALLFTALLHPAFAMEFRFGDEGVDFDAGNLGKFTLT